MEDFKQDPENVCFGLKKKPIYIAVFLQILAIGLIQCITDNLKSDI